MNTPRVLLPQELPNVVAGTGVRKLHCRDGDYHIGVDLDSGNLVVQGEAK